MVLVDTSVWVEHLRAGAIGLQPLLEEGKVVCHPFVIGELALGTMARRAEVLSLLQSLPTASVLEPDEILPFIDRHSLMGKGLGLVDLHLLASALLTRTPLWTMDKRLRDAVSAFGLSHPTRG